MKTQTTGGMFCTSKYDLKYINEKYTKGKSKHIQVKVPFNLLIKI